MGEGNVEERLSNLEKTVAALENRLSGKSSKDWASTVGMFDNDPIMGEIIDDALEARAKERRAFYDEFDNGNGSE